jgi:hypothetical protein
MEPDRRCFPARLHVCETSRQARNPTLTGKLLAHRRGPQNGFVALSGLCPGQQDGDWLLDKAFVNSRQPPRASPSVAQRALWRGPRAIDRGEPGCQWYGSIVCFKQPTAAGKSRRQELTDVGQGRGRLEEMP